MTDTNHDGIDDETEAAVAKALAAEGGKRISLDLRSALIGGVVALALGSGTLAMARSMWPDNGLVIGFGQWFASGVCIPVETERDRYKNAWACIEGGAAATGVDISTCAAKLETEPVE